MCPSFQPFPAPPALGAEDWGLHKREGLVSGGSVLGSCHLRQRDGQRGLGGTKAHSGQRLGGWQR